MTKITEDAVEHIAIKLLEEQGYSYIYGPTIAPDGENPQIKWDAIKGYGIGIRDYDA